MRSLLQVRVPRSNQDSTTTTPRHKACRRRSETHRRLAWQFGAGQPQVYSTSHEHCADSPHRHSQPGKTLSGRLEASGSAVVTRRGMCVKKLYAGQPATSARDVAMGGAEQRVLDSEKLFPLIASRRPSRGPGRSPGALDSPARTGASGWNGRAPPDAGGCGRGMVWKGAEGCVKAYGRAHL